MSDREFQAVAGAFATSLPGRLITASVSGIGQAWQGSSIASGLRRRAGGFQRQPAPDRVRLTAATLAWAAFLHLAARTWLPQYATSALPWWWNAVAVIMAVTVALNAQTLASAWGQSAAGRVWKWIAGSDEAAVGQHRGLQPD